MTDIYLSSAREDAELVEPIVKALRGEGWTVWFEPDASPARRNQAIDAELGAAGAVFVLWTSASRGSDFVRTEAATGLYRNKLVQARFDSEVPPRPFDQLETLDLAGWTGGEQDPVWQRILGIIRLYAGSPGSTRPQVVRNSAAGFAHVEAESSAPQVRQASTGRPARRAVPSRSAAGATYANAPLSQKSFEMVEPQWEEDVAEAQPAAPEPVSEPLAVEDIFAPQTQTPVANDSYGYSDEAAQPVAGYDQPYEPENQPELSIPSSQQVGGTVRYAEPRSGFPVSIIAVGVVALLGAGVWFVDPMGWRGEAETVAAEAVSAVEVAMAGVAVETPAAVPPIEIGADANEAWAAIDRNDPASLRAFLAAHPESTTAETAIALVRVLDAQAWAVAVETDTEAAYGSYMRAFPQVPAEWEGVVPNGAMLEQATARIGSLVTERRQAVTALQTGLRELNLYGGAANGEIDVATRQAAARFASEHGGEVPALETAAPRDLRQFNDRIRRVSSAAAVAETVVPDSPAVAGTVDVAGVDADSSADTDVVLSDADTLASAQLAVAEASAWLAASEAQTVAQYRIYLRDFPVAENAATARAEIARLLKPPPFGAVQLTGDTRAAIDAARASQTSATQRANAARSKAEQADQAAASARSGEAGYNVITAPDGDRYETQVSDSRPNGVGVRVAGDAVSVGDRYRGDLRDGLGQGLGVYEYGANPNNQSAQALRYEGEYAGDEQTGAGVTYWRNGNRFEGQRNGAEATGVMIFQDGTRYEGEMTNLNRNGYGVFWNSDGSLRVAGLWENGALVEPMAKAETE